MLSFLLICIDIFTTFTTIVNIIKFCIISGIVLYLLLVLSVIISKIREKTNSNPQYEPTSKSVSSVNATPAKNIASFIPKSYEQLYRHDTTTHNLNYDTYSFSGRFIETNRMRSNRNIEIFGKADVKNEIIRMGYSEPINYHLLTPISVTDKQIAYLRDLMHGSVPNNLSLFDAQALISRILEHDRIPNPQLFDYATQMKIPVSYYIGKKGLYDTIFSKLPERERSAFFVFCVYRFLTKDYSTANLLTSPHRSTFYEFADQVSDDISFNKSLSKINGSSLRFFGSRSVNGNVIYGASKNTIAYKRAEQFLRDKHFYLS